MKTRIFLPVVSAAIFLTTSPIFAGPPAAELRWSEPEDGLQMAVAVEPESGYLHGWIRSGGNAMRTVNNYFLGYFEKLHVEVRDGAGWKPLERDANVLRAYTGIGPGPSNLEQLPPFQSLVGKRSADWAPGRHFSGLPPATRLSDSFAVDPGDFVWPAESLRAAKIEVRVVQELSGPGLAAPVSIHSPVVELDGPWLRGLLEQLNIGAIFNRDFQEHSPRPEPPAAPPPNGTVIFKQQLPDGVTVRIESALITRDEDGPLGKTAVTCRAYTLIATPPGAPDVVLWMKRGPVSETVWGRPAGIVPFEVVQEGGWTCLLYTYFSELFIETFRFSAEGKIERLHGQGLGQFSLAPADHAVGFQHDGSELKVVYSRPPDEYPRSDFLFVPKKSPTGWEQLPAKKLVPKKSGAGRK